MTPADLCYRGMSPDTPAPRVSFTVDDDSHARAIEDVLEALGFEAVRSMDSTNALHWGLIRLVRKYSITKRERLVLELMLTEQLDDEQMARQIKTGVGTVVFLRSQILVKAGVPDREQLLRLAMQLPVIESPALAAG
jgi:DNA-binding CsgD family transcriptional regulator